MIFYVSSDFRPIVKVYVTEVRLVYAQSCACGSHAPWFDTAVVATNNQFKNSIRATFLLFAFQIMCPHCTAVHRGRMTANILLSYFINKP